MTLAILQGDFRRWLIDRSQEAADRIGPAAGPGLCVYQNNYRAQLVGCLSETYERTQAWLGEEAFVAAAVTHIDDRPPSAWTLDAYPAGFADTLAALYPDDAEVAELAWLEWALSRAFTAADADPIAPDRLAAVDWDEAVIRFAPGLITRKTTTNAAAIWAALTADQMPPPVELLPEPAALLVWRQGYVPNFRTIDATEAYAIKLVEAGHSFGALCAALVATWGEEEGIAHAGALLGQWIGDGLIVGIQPAKLCVSSSRHE